MLVCIDKITCGRMYELIRVRWEAKIQALELKLAAEELVFSRAGKVPTGYVERLRAQIAWMRETRMAAVFSPEQNEVKEFAAWKMDVRPHRTLMRNGMEGRALVECFKDSGHPFRVAIVCAMWLTGFDVKPLATLYLDKPMQGHTLMQAIARVNRVAAHKKNGLIIDYNGMLKSLRRALATFAQGDRGGPVVDPLRDDTQALADYANAITRGRAHLTGLGYELDALIDAKGFEKQQELLLAVNAVCRSPESKKTFQVLVEDLEDRFRGLFPNPGLFALDAEENALAAIYNRLRKPTDEVDISGILQELHAVVDTALETAPPSQALQSARKQYDLSGIDFERLRAEFAKSPVKQIVVLSLMEKIEARLAAMLATNPTRIDFYNRYRAIVDEYNKDKDEPEIQRVFEELFRTHDSLDLEALRYSREGFDNDEQLAVFDLLSKDKTTLSKGDRDKIKKVAMSLLAQLETRKQEMANLRDRASAQANLKATIIDEMLNGMPDEFSSEEIDARAEILFRHVGRHWAASSSTGPGEGRVVH